MAFWKRTALVDASARLRAIDLSQAVIEFDTSGDIQYANTNFLALMGYSLGEVQGKHHSIFIDQKVRGSIEYCDFWSALNRGDFQSGEFKRIANGGREVWIQATYTPILNRAGHVERIVKFATDVTAKKLQNLLDAGRIAALNRSQAVIEFNLDGIITTANENFLKTMGYSLAEIQGKHHSMFVEEGVRDGIEYREFWKRLRAGEFNSAEYKRIGKNGKEVWIIASYNPVLDDTGRPTAIIKFATDVTDAKLQNANFSGQIEAISKSQAVIEFDMDGTIRTANGNFLHAVGYTLSEIQGRNHSIFVHPTERGQSSYLEFWKHLRDGQYVSAEFRRISKEGTDIWIQGSYNPILDLNGHPFKVVKFAVDVTLRVLARHKSEEVRDMMSKAASGADELKSSVQQIATAMDLSQETASAASEDVHNADAQAKRLSSASKAMGGIVELIGNITGQINLLALNATIESARAGEAGRGFAVVASEVKNLANQAKAATDQISSEIEGVNEISTDVVGSLSRISGSMSRVREYVVSTARAIREQSAVSESMSTNMQIAAAEADKIKF